MSEQHRFNEKQTELLMQHYVRIITKFRVSRIEKELIAEELNGLDGGRPCTWKHVQNWIQNTRRRQPKKLLDQNVRFLISAARLIELVDASIAKKKMCATVKIEQ